MGQQSDKFDDYIFNVDGEQKLNKQKALAKLLDAGIVYPITKTIIRDSGNDRKQKTTVLFVSCNDVFAPATSMGVPVQDNELKPLLKAHLTQKYGSVKWACKKKNVAPHEKLINDIKEAGEWDKDMEKLTKQ